MDISYQYMDEVDILPWSFSEKVLKWLSIKRIEVTPAHLVYRCEEQWLLKDWMQT